MKTYDNPRNLSSFSLLLLVENLLILELDLKKKE